MADKQANIQELTLEDIMGDRFGRYSKYIIQERALPDVRDGLKPVQRRILFAMNKDGNTHDKAFRKSAKSVGNVMGNFHPHGDSSIYEALVRMSQDWKLRVPLIEMHGNNGSIDNDPPAAMRYTEARLSQAAESMLSDIDKETVDMVLNFDDTELEPTVLPARFPNLLVNGATGISAGYATEIPTHNLGEVIDAALYCIKHDNPTLEKLMSFVKGPDFPTGGIIQGLDGLKKAYKTGRGRVIIRSKTAINDLKGNKKEIRVSEIPYEVNKAVLVKKIDEIRVAKKVDGIAEVRDESDRDGLSIAIELKKDVDAQGILNYLLKNTDLQVSYNFNMVAINNKRPEHMGLKAILQSYVKFQKEVITKRTQFDLKKAQARLHIVEGLIKALSILSDVIKTIRQSKDKKDAKQNLINNFAFSEKQAEAIVSLQLYRLTNTDVTALQAEAKDLNDNIAEFNLILNDENELAKVLSKELREMKKQYATPRKSEIQDQIEELVVAKTVTVPEEQVMVLVTKGGYLKRSSLRSYKASADDDGVKDDDQIIFKQELNTLDHLMMFTNQGNLIHRPVYEISETRWKDVGEHISQTIGLASDESIIKAVCVHDFKEPLVFLTATNDGYIKRTTLANYAPGRNYRKNATMYIKLKSDLSRVVAITALPADISDKTVFLASKNGYGLRYQIDEIPESGARAAGVKSMDLRDDEVASVAIVNEDSEVGIITNRGAFKKMKVAEVSPTSRARRGVQILRELKRDPHRIVAMLNVDKQAIVEVITDREQRQDIILAKHHPADRYSNGSFVLDTDVQGQPITMIYKSVSHVTA